METEFERMRIAIIGTRGIPANYGGFETFAEELSARLAERGHDVTVYGRSHYIDRAIKEHRGAKVRVLPGITHKYLDTPFNTLLASLDVMFRRYDILLYCNSANAFCTLFPRLTGKRIILNVDGLEWKRAKWNPFGQAVYKISEFLSTIIPQVIVTDAVSVQEYYQQKFGCPSFYIPYGSAVSEVETQDVLKKFNVEKRKYILYVSRLEPENNAHVVIKAFEKVKTDMKLVIVGDAPYSDAYIKELKSTQDPRIIFTGYVFGSGYHEFQSNAYAYVQATEVGGTHPALVEGMGHGNCVIANDVPEHREVVADTGVYFTTQDISSLTRQMEALIANPEQVAMYRQRALERVATHYTWDAVTTAYEKLFRKVSGKRSE